ncbi:hypothetical protein [Pseudonocardia sp. KRD291]|uniref:hypothetical protein n=1 Tax=Pseudonocardia sp. KRD291 TaxID=2792007 RepID=UPI001C49D9D9|nr:hypothetical protein [Pseudonocardia sp. KRD291]MBW0106454.1 hypothetical protein [Pseudonocardia sp. KRD291]
MHSGLRKVTLGLTTLAAALVVAGCGGSDAVQVSGPPTPTFPPGVVPSATLDDTRTKLSSIAQDECARDDPAAIYPTCGRFVSEVQASLPAVREQAPNATRAADTVQSGIGRFVSGGCVNAANSGPAGDPRTCGPALATLQADVRDLVTAVGR